MAFWKKKKEIKKDENLLREKIIKKEDRSFLEKENLNEEVFFEIIKNCNNSDSKYHLSKEEVYKVNEILTNRVREEGKKVWPSLKGYDFTKNLSDDMSSYKLDHILQRRVSIHLINLMIFHKCYWQYNLFYKGSFVQAIGIKKTRSEGLKAIEEGNFDRERRLFHLKMHFTDEEIEAISVSDYNFYFLSDTAILMDFIYSEYINEGYDWRDREQFVEFCDPSSNLHSSFYNFSKWEEQPDVCTLNEYGRVVYRHGRYMGKVTDYYTYMEERKNKESPFYNTLLCKCEDFPSYDDLKYNAEKIFPEREACFNLGRGLSWGKDEKMHLDYTNTLDWEDPTPGIRMLSAKELLDIYNSVMSFDENYDYMFYKGKQDPDKRYYGRLGETKRSRGKYWGFLIYKNLNFDGPIKESPEYTGSDRREYDTWLE